MLDRFGFRDKSIVVSERTNIGKPQNRRWVFGVLLVVVMVYIGYFSAYQIRRHQTYQTHVDLLAMEQTIWNTLHGRFMRSTVYPPTGTAISDFSKRVTESRLGTHVQPLLLILALPYALFPRSETLLVIMCVAIGLGVFPLYAIAYREFRHVLIALLFSGVYLFLPAVQTLNAWDIHGTVFLLPLLLAALNAVERNKRFWCWGWVLLAMGCREDAPFLVGWAMLWLAPFKKRSEAWLMFGMGLVFSLVNFLVIIPYFAGEATPYLTQFLPPGSQPTLVGVWTAVQQPSFRVTKFGHFVKYNLLLGLPLCFLYWLDWRTLLAIAPTMLLNSLNWKPSMHVPSYSHYSAPIMAWVLIGSIRGFARLERWLLIRNSDFHWRSVLSEALVVSVLAAHFVTGYTPLSRAFVWPRPSGQEESMRALLAKIPPEVPVSLDMYMAAHEAQRSDIRIFPDTRDVEWIGINLWLGGDLYGGIMQEQLQHIAKDPIWEMVSHQDGLVLLRRGSGPPMSLLKAYQFAEECSESGLHVQFGEIGSDLRLCGVTVIPRAVRHFDVCTDWILPDSSPDAFPILSLGPGKIPGSSTEGVWEIPWLMRQPDAPSVVRACTHLVVKMQGGEVQLDIALQSAQGRYFPAKVLDVGEWQGALTEGNEVVTLHLSSGRGRSSFK